MIESKREEKGLSMEDICRSLINSLSNDETLRKESMDYISDCEQNSLFCLELVQIFEQYAPTAPNFDIEILKKQIIICLKNVIQRKWNLKTQRTLFKAAGILLYTYIYIYIYIRSMYIVGNKVEIEEEVKGKVREFIIRAIDQDLPYGIFTQILQILAIICRIDFPNKWPQLVTYFNYKCELLFNSLSTVFAQSLQLTEGHEIVKSLYKLIKICSKMLKEQRKKKLESSKTHFYGIAQTLIENISKIWYLFAQNLPNIFVILNPDTKRLEFGLGNYNESVHKLSNKMDKLLLELIKVSFSQKHTILGQNCIEIISKKNEKIRYSLTFFEDLSNYFERSAEEQRPAIEEIMKRIINNLGSNIYLLSELQSFETVLLCEHLDIYLVIIRDLMGLASRIKESPLEYIVSEEITKSLLMGLLRTLSCSDLASEGSSKHAAYISPSKPVSKPFLEKYITMGKKHYENFFTSETIEGLFSLIATRFLPLKSFHLWREEIESFIEQEDDAFTNEFEIDIDSSLSAISLHTLQQFGFNFPHISTQVLQNLLGMQERSSSPNVILEDALLNALQILTRIQDPDPNKLRINITQILNYVHARIINPRSNEELLILQRRFMIMVARFTDYIPGTIYIYIYIYILVRGISRLGSRISIINDV